MELLFVVVRNSQSLSEFVVFLLAGIVALNPDTKLAAVFYAAIEVNLDFHKKIHSKLVEAPENNVFLLLTGLQLAKHLIEVSSEFLDGFHSSMLDSQLHSSERLE
jgi:hypothetical protein